MTQWALAKIHTKKKKKRKLHTYLPTYPNSGGTVTRNKAFFPLRKFLLYYVLSMVIQNYTHVFSYLHAIKQNTLGQGESNRSVCWICVHFYVSRSLFCGRSHDHLHT